MPRKKQPRPTDTDLLSLLSEETRAQVVNEALGSKVFSILEHCASGTVGDLVNELTRDPLWSMMRNVSVSSVFSTSGGRGGAAFRRVGIGRGGRRRIDESTLSTILKVVQKAPGLRSEQIQKQLTYDRGTVKLGLAKLRDEKRVKTSGTRRAMTYAANQ